MASSVLIDCYEHHAPVSAATATGRRRVKERIKKPRTCLAGYAETRITGRETQTLCDYNPTTEINIPTLTTIAPARNAVMEIPPQFIPTDLRVAPETGNYNSHLIVYFIQDSIKDAIQHRAERAGLAQCLLGDRECQREKWAKVV